MIVTTTDGIEGKMVSVYLGIVTGEAVLGANIFCGYTGYRRWAFSSI